jgi:hypothetical protein
LKPGNAYAYFNMAITYALDRDYKQAMVWIREGAKYCSPVAFQRFVSDSDFEGMRDYPEFQQMLQQMYGEVPISFGANS